MIKYAKFKCNSKYLIFFCSSIFFAEYQLPSRSTSRNAAVHETNEHCLLSSFIAVATNHNKELISAALVYYPAPAGWCRDEQSVTCSRVEWSSVVALEAVDGVIVYKYILPNE
jgi:hypothetical protein